MSAPIQPGETWKMTVLGTPKGQGSMSGIPVMKWDAAQGKKVPVLNAQGYPIVNVTSGKESALKPWRADIAQTAIAMGWPGMGFGELDEALIVQLTFYVKRPESHFGTGRNAGVIKDSSPLYPATTGDDIDKLARGALDALTGIVWKDDKRIVTMPTRRRYGTPERLELAVRRPRAQTIGDLRRLRDLNPLAAEALADELQLDLFAALPGSAEHVAA